MTWRTSGLSVGNLRKRRLQRRGAWVKEGVELEGDPRIERWPSRAVTGTIAEQRRDDETGYPCLPPPC